MQPSLNTPARTVLEAQPPAQRPSAALLSGIAAYFPRETCALTHHMSGTLRTCAHRANQQLLLLSKNSNYLVHCKLGEPDAEPAAVARKHAHLALVCNVLRQTDPIDMQPAAQRAQRQAILRPFSIFTLLVHVLLKKASRNLRSTPLGQQQ